MLTGEIFTLRELVEKDLHAELELLTSSNSPIFLKAYRQNISGYLVNSFHNPTNNFHEDNQFAEPVFVRASDLIAGR